jgi:pimeloyl-ACP methyl ester carboxylesterase
MATARVNGVGLFYQVTGEGDPPLVLVHGSWGSHEQWAAAAAHLSRSFRVVTYDRRGHSRSERLPGQGSVREDVGDLAALIEHLGLAPAWVAGNSFGGSIALRLAGERPELLRGVLAHEPPLFSLLAADAATAPMLQEVGPRVGAVVERIAAGDYAAAAELFVETVALGPGSWAQFPPEMRQTFIENAATFLDEAGDPEQLAFDPSSIRAFAKASLLSLGDHSPPLFEPVVRKLATLLPTVEVRTLRGAGHIPHFTHPSLFAEMVASFVRKERDGTSGGG